MANIMIKRGTHDNVLTYTHVCDTLTDLQQINPRFATMGSYAIVLKGIDNKYTEYMADSNGQWVRVFISTSGGGGGGGTSNLGIENAGKMVKVGDDGYIAPSNITEAALVDALMNSGIYVAVDAVGLEVDYENRSFVRIQEAANYSQGSDFNKYSMYGGRMRCNVNDAGEITAWYGDSAYKEDGSNGQVMVYQPKFYYARSYFKTVFVSGGEAIRKESLIISPTAQTGFKLHPLFRDTEGNELDYVLLSAYEGCAQIGNNYDLYDSSNINFNTDKLASIAGAKPITGVNKQLTIASSEQLAKNRGTGWHITNMTVESAQQMLQMIEYGSPNSQASLELGICYIPNNSSYNCASLTGSTSNLGNATGHADSTRNEIHGSYHDYTDAGKRAISYRGFENPWGNCWRMVGGTVVSGNGSQAGGIMYVCSDFNYTNDVGQSNYTSLGFQMPSQGDWISGFGKTTDSLDWVYSPIECSGASSAVPVGDHLWVERNANGTYMLNAGGRWDFELNNGMFYYAIDQAVTAISRSLNPRLMFIPTKNTAYTANIASWQAKMGG